MADKFAMDTMTALEKFNNDYSTQWDLGSNWSSVETDFEPFINKYLFPKINETSLIGYDLGNRFDWLNKEVEQIGQFSEEYVFLDIIPINMNLSKSAELMLKTNYPNMATKLYGSGVVKKTKFTINNNDARLNFSTLGDAVTYALGIYKKRVSDINVTEELETKGMLIDYALNHVDNVRTVSNLLDMSTAITNALLNLQNNTHKYNESKKASGGSLGRFTTQTKLEDVAILTTDAVKTYLLDTKLANTFQVAGIDFTSKIISFEDLGGVYRTTDNVTITEPSTIKVFRAFGDYQIEIGDIIPKDAILTFEDVETLDEFIGNIEEIKPDTDLFAYVFDIRKPRLRRNTKGMLKRPFENPEFDNTTHWLHYYQSKEVSPFYNSVVIKEG